MINFSNVDALIFDLDGTLWDATSSIAKAWQDVATEFDLDLKIDQVSIRQVSGLPFEECVKVLFGPAVLKIPKLSATLDEAERNAVGREGGRIYEGVVLGLRELKKRYQIFLVSNCQEWYLDAFLNHSGTRTLFEDSLCFGQTLRPKGDNILEIMNRHKLRCPVYVGDTHWDHEASRFAGVVFIFASYGFGSVGSLCFSVDSFDNLVKLMNPSTPRGN